NGVQVATNGFDLSPQVTSDRTGGAIVTWTGYGCDLYNIYAQRLRPDGTRMWDSTRTTVCDEPNEQDLPAITGDGTGGAIIAWEDRRPDSAGIYTQRIDHNGT